MACVLLAISGQVLGWALFALIGGILVASVIAIYRLMGRTNHVHSAINRTGPEAPAGPQAGRHLN